ncbi:hypothetical protein [Kribbella deserti]|uniref:Uncharacterized protein n=1 Tax=Kribbella deserti TaxID=1926257 RepID=A0ABV6QGL8_9ACTN
MEKRRRNRWYDRGLLALAGIGLTVDLTLPQSRLGTIALLLVAIWCVRRVLVRIDETSEQFEQAFRLGQEIEQRRIVLDRELAPVRELVRQADESAPGTASCRNDQVVDLTARAADLPARARPGDAEPGSAIVLATARARRRKRNRRRP